MYYQKYKDDRWQLRMLVALAWPIARLLELGHMFCVSAEIYKATITYYGRPDKLFPFPFLGASTAVGGGIAFLAHSFFSVRVFRALPRPWNCVGAVTFLIALVRFIGSIILAARAVSAPGLEEYRRSVGWMAVSLLSMGSEGHGSPMAHSGLTLTHTHQNPYP
ncbi:hypothetical protein CC1G_12257 [Coprinopsis cinerea okayama7|uniref:Uncharacterized protein n=1 Tax=Coprinopsis cinerea (strain Okayama-7 / 130 / ATCC MYA-4618 / FGSC 9003) TaxID=240176 RepID=A8P777_COPC7|nr:hypothetical protein CC1G_12257 [Coprinopsis cinerea okayama7\|eukprot:XP_001839309.1 hypothetical protein CC1G_12257 [Coprinopsis cinerea okayama7\